MITILLCILVTSALLVIFKYFEIFKVNTFQAITVNYAVAATLGYVLAPAQVPPMVLLGKPWMLSAVLLGMFFIGVFYLMALSSQKVGVAVSSVANKMSLVIPVAAGFILYGESATWMKLVGILCALVAVVMVTFSSEKKQTEKKYLILPVLVFLGSGAIDTAIKFLQVRQVGAGDFGMFTSAVFLIAATVGTSVLIGRRLLKGETLTVRSIVAGFVLGIPNYFSLHFLLKALSIPELESTVVFPINNTGIVLMSTLLAMMLFKEQLSKINWGGILLAILSILLIATA